MRPDEVTVAGIGGSTRPGSSTETALRAVLAEAERLGARTLCLTAGDLVLPPYESGGVRGPRQRRLVEAMAGATALVLASPAYHGTMSGLVKNALDYAEDLREHPAPYFSGRPVGLLAVARGAQGAASALASLRSTVHALRGWPTPLGVTVDTSRACFGPDGRCLDPRLQHHFTALAEQLVGFARHTSAIPACEVGTQPARA
ncbi:NAD(P)H-dependent oxidoreductase [Streptomyces sp. MB09-01]|uniref:NADPH-dependent FMN reductase n=1 Tax=Streptomyces sp. MB09-01 TaxID=3028666 RepID=UPI0029AEDAA3|nr:NAD(P)H-dependent oxidoreductase [Streptomyces sp. MB09-01]MDX3537514.1 NAD(P)H-dependent oxidoreductase [Streptomyces sp. MB09-01]